MTLEELYAKTLSDENLKKEFFKANKEGKLADFLAANGCEASPKEAEEFISKKQTQTGEISDDELDDVSGGRKCGTTYYDGYPVVTHCNSCEHYISRDYMKGYTDDKSSGNGMCSDCNCFSCTGLLYVCTNPKRYEN